MLNVTGDHLGLRDIDTIEQLAAVKRVIVEAVPRDGYAVLNADDELVLEMRKHCSGNVILFTMREDHELIERWVRRGRKAVVLQHDEKGELIVLRDGRRSMPVGYTHQFPATFDGRARMNVQNLLAAVAAAHVSGAHLHDIRHGLRTFTTDFFQAPGRLNLVDLGGRHGVARLRAQRGRSADGGGLRRAHDVGAAAEHVPVRRRGRRTCGSRWWPRRATVATRTCASSDGSPPATSTR